MCTCVPVRLCTLIQLETHLSVPQEHMLTIHHADKRSFSATFSVTPLPLPLTLCTKTARRRRMSSFCCNKVGASNLQLKHTKLAINLLHVYGCVCVWVHKLLTRLPAMSLAKSLSHLRRTTTGFKCTHTSTGTHTSTQLFSHTKSAISWYEIRCGCDCVWWKAQALKDRNDLNDWISWNCSLSLRPGAQATKSAYSYMCVCVIGYFHVVIAVAPLITRSSTHAFKRAELSEIRRKARKGSSSRNPDIYAAIRYKPLALRHCTIMQQCEGHVKRLNARCGVKPYWACKYLLVEEINLTYMPLCQGNTLSSFNWKCDGKGNHCSLN